MTEAGAFLVLKHLPNLKIFKFNSSLQVVAQMNPIRMASVPDQACASSQQQQSACNRLVRRLPLMNLHCWPSVQFPYVSGGLAAAIQCCPSVVQVDIVNVRGIFDRDLRALLDLQNLQHLSLGRMEVSFEGGLLPILEKFGPDSLEQLELCSLTEVNVAAIAKHCTNLRSLSLRSIDRYTPLAHVQSKRLPHQFQSLKHLEMYNDRRHNNGAPTLTDLSFLISSPWLIAIELSGLENLSDQLIERMALFHCFLKRLSLVDCPNVTPYSIDFLLVSDSPIAEINIKSCAKLLLTDANKWVKLAQESNWDLSIIWNNQTLA